MHSPEGYHTAVISGVFLRLNAVLLNDAERCLVARSDGIHLMACQGTVEIQPSVGIHIADGNSVWVATVTEESQCAGSGSLQYTDALFLRKLLALAPHSSEFHVTK